MGTRVFAESELQLISVAFGLADAAHELRDLLDCGQKSSLQMAEQRELIGFFWQAEEVMARDIVSGRDLVNGRELCDLAQRLAIRPDHCGDGIHDCGVFLLDLNVLRKRDSVLKL